MKERYGSFPKWLDPILGYTRGMDIIASRQHDHDYGTKGYKLKGQKRAKTREEADLVYKENLRRLGMSTVCAFLIWVGCRVFLKHKWRIKE